jgi:hypothetical protein
MQKLASFFVALGLILAGLTVPVLGEGSDQVSATVSAKVISVNISVASVSYGALQVGTTMATPTPASFSVVNDGNVAERFNIKGSNTTAWTLGAVQGPNTYVHRFSTNGTNFSALTLSDQQLFASVAPNADILVYLNMDLPTTTSTGAQQTAVVTIIALEASP